MVAKLTPALLDDEKTTVEAVQTAMIKDLKEIAKLPPGSKAKVWFYVAPKVRLKNFKLKPINLLIVTNLEAQRKLWEMRLKDQTPKATTGLCKVEMVKDQPSVTIGALKGSGDRKAVMLTARVALKDAGATKVKLADERDASKHDVKTAGKEAGGKAAFAQAATKTEQMLTTFHLNPKTAANAGKQLGVSTDIVNLIISQNEAKLKAAIDKALRDAGLAAAS